MPNYTIENIRGHCNPLHENEIYVGRKNPRYELGGSPLANPFVLRNEFERTSVIERYREWLASRIIAADRTVLEELKRILTIGRSYRELHLFCWCRPRACHADVIAEILREQWRLDAR
jgi:Domain of unknown function (DUF4326)